MQRFGSVGLRKMPALYLNKRLKLKPRNKQVKVNSFIEKDNAWTMHSVVLILRFLFEIKLTHLVVVTIPKFS